MNKHLAIAFTVLLTNCSENRSEAVKEEIKTNLVALDTFAIGNKIYAMQDLTDTNVVFERFNYYDASDSAYIEKHKEFVSRTGDTLFLKCDNGKVIKLKSNRDDGDYEVYDFKYINKDLNAFVLLCSFYEAADVWLVNKTNGDTLKTIGYPVVSPNKKQFVCYNIDLEAAFSLNGFELFDNTNGNYKRKGLREINEWGPERVKWKDDTTLIVRALSGYGDPTKISVKALYIK